jgi:outer membrane protein assembly factor BamD
MRTYLPLVLLVLFAAACSKEIPPPAPFVAEQAFEEGNQFLEDKKYEEARSKFEEVRRKDTKNLYAPLAQLRIADSYIREDEPEIAADEYRRFIESYPRHKYSSYAQYQIGMVYFNMISGPARGWGAAVRAVDEFETLQRRYPRNPYKDDVILKIRTARQVIADHEFQVGDFYFRKKAYQGAIARLTGLLRDFPEYGAEDEALYRLAVSHKGAGEDAEADRYLQRLASRYPESELIEKAQRRFRKFEEKD